MSKTITPVKNQTVILADAAESHELKAGTSLLIDDQTIDLAISLAKSATGSSLAINGAVSIKGQQSPDGVELRGEYQSVTIGKTGSLTSSYGGFFTASDAFGASITIAGKMTTGSYGARLKGDQTELRIAKGGQIVAGGAGVEFNTSDSANRVTITNAGLLSSTGLSSDVSGKTAILSNGSINLVNTGKIIGDIKAGSGDDVFDIAKGTLSGKIYGGSGEDLYIVSGQKQLALIDGVQSVDTIRSAASISLAARDNLEHVELAGAANRNATGNALDNRLTGNAGANILSGLDGNDTLVASLGNDRLAGGNGSDTADYSAFTRAIRADLNTGKVSVLALGKADTLVAVENVTGGAGNDILTGNAEANVLEGGAGNDWLSGGAGTDQLDGGLGDDRHRWWRGQ